jgi:hypothetical protein
MVSRPWLLQPTSAISIDYPKACTCPTLPITSRIHSYSPFRPRLHGPNGQKKASFEFLEEIKKKKTLKDTLPIPSLSQTPTPFNLPLFNTIMKNGGLSINRRCLDTFRIMICSTRPKSLNVKNCFQSGLAEKLVRQKRFRCAVQRVPSDGMEHVEQIGPWLLSGGGVGKK